jgi:hypothetical protein
MGPWPSPGVSLRRAFEADGPSAPASRKRDHPSSRWLGEALRCTVFALVRERYADCGPTLAAEKLVGCHGPRFIVDHAPWRGGRCGAAEGRHSQRATSGESPSYTLSKLPRNIWTHWCSRTEIILGWPMRSFRMTGIGKKLQRWPIKNVRFWGLHQMPQNVLNRRA